MHEVIPKQPMAAPAPKAAPKAMPSSSVRPTSSTAHDSSGEWSEQVVWEVEGQVDDGQGYPPHDDGDDANDAHVAEGGIDVGDHDDRRGDDDPSDGDDDGLVPFEVMRGLAPWASGRGGSSSSKGSKGSKGDGKGLPESGGRVRLDDDGGIFDALFTFQFRNCSHWFQIIAVVYVGLNSLWTSFAIQVWLLQVRRSQHVYRTFRCTGSLSHVICCSQ